MSNQLIKTTELGKENVFPRTRILDLFDDTSGLKLIDILKSFNMMFVPYLGNKSYTRNQISPELRRQGLWLTYVIDNTVYTEWYDEVAIDDTNWGSDANWRQGSNALVGDLSISPNGTWVINGEDSGITIKGDKGDSPVIRIYDNKILVSYNKGVTYEDLNNTPVYTKFRFNSLTNTYLVSYDLGDTWLDISNEKVYHKFRYNSTTNTYLESIDFGKTWSNISAEKVYTKFRFNRSTNTYQVSTDLGLNWTDVSSDKVYYQFRYNGETNTHLVSTDFGTTWTNVSDDKVFYLFRTNDNRLLVSTDLGTTWENCSEPIAAWFRWADVSGTGNVGKVLISRDLLNWSDLSPTMTNNLYIKGYVSTVGELPTSSAAIGDIYMVGPTYDEGDSTHNYPHYRMWVKQSNGWVDNGEFTNAGPVSTDNIINGAITYNKLQSEMKEVVENMYYLESPEFVKMYCDADGRLIWWINTDGSVDWAKGVPAPIQKELRKLEQDIAEGDESVVARVTANEAAIVAINDALNNYKDEVSEALSKKMDGEYIDGTEYIHVYIDGEDKKIWSLSNDGNLKHYTHNEFNSISIFDKMSMGEVEDTYIIDSEEYLKIIIDAEDRIIFSVKPNGLCFCDLEDIAKIKSIIDEIQSELPKKDLDLLDELLDNPLSEIKTTPELAASFRSWGFIGDSLASGEHEYTKEDGSKGFIDIYEYSWGAHICRMCGVSYSPLTSIPDGSDPDNCNGYNYSYGGQTSWGWIQAGVRGWLGAQKHPKQGYILALGVNDYRYIQKYDTYKPLLDNAISKGSIDYQLTANESKVITDSTGTSQGIITKVKSMIDNSLVTALTYNNIQYYAISYSGDTVVFAAYDTETKINTIMAKDVSNEATWSIDPFQYGVALGNIESDIDLEDFNNNANTYIGNYAGIIQRLRSVSPRCRIFTVTPPNIPLAQTVRDISTLFDNVFVIDLDKYVGYLYSNSTFRSRYFLGGHMNAAGYLWTAYVFMTYISWYIRKEPAKFSELAFWDSDKHI